LKAITHFMIPISLSERSDAGDLILLGVIGFVKDFMRIWFPERSAGGLL